MNIKAIIHPAEEGGYWAEVPALPGCITEGDSMEEVMANLKDAIEGWLEVANSRSVIAPIDRVIEMSEIEKDHPLYQRSLDLILDSELSKYTVLKGNLSAGEIHDWIASL